MIDTDLWGWPVADSLLGPGSEALAGKVAHQIEGLASKDVLEPLIQALLPYSQEIQPGLAGSHPPSIHQAELPNCLQ